MAYIKTKLRCSECGTTRECALNTDDKDIVCPVCARRIQNLTPDEHTEMLAVQKKQGIFCVISIVLFVLCAGLWIFWMGETASWTSGAATRNAEAALFWAGLVSGVAAMVLGIMGSWRRFVIEF